MNICDGCRIAGNKMYELTMFHFKPIHLGITGCLFGLVYFFLSHEILRTIFLWVGGITTAVLVWWVLYACVWWFLSCITDRLE